MAKKKTVRKVKSGNDSLEETVEHLCQLAKLQQVLLDKLKDQIFRERK